MKNHTIPRFVWRTVLALPLLGAVAGVALVAQASLDQARTPRPPTGPPAQPVRSVHILAPEADHYYFHKNYGEWAAEWWKWALSIPAAEHPLNDVGDCGAGQSGPVWFLGGSFASASAVRECTVPSGKTIFFPVINAECSTVEVGTIWYGGTEAELRDCAKGWMDGANSLYCFIDGQPVANLERFRVLSPLFGFPAVAGSILGNAEETVGVSITDGVYLMLPPFSPGRHTIHFGGNYSGDPLNPFIIEFTYNLTVLRYCPADK